MKKIIAAIDSSSYLQSICDLASWSYKKINAKQIDLLHVVSSNYEFEVKSDLSGSIGFDAQSELMNELIEIDKKRSKLEQEKGEAILNHAKKNLEQRNINQIEILHRRGSFSKAVEEFSQNCDLIILGKKSEKTENSNKNIGSNIEKVARTIHKPILIAAEKFDEIQNFLIAYDGSKSSNAVLEFICASDLLKGHKCHLLKISEINDKSREIINQAKTQLEESGFEVVDCLAEAGDMKIKEVISNYIDKNNINLLAIGAFGHSKIRNFFLGSSTNDLIENTQLPILIFR